MTECLGQHLRLRQVERILDDRQHSEIARHWSQLGRGRLGVVVTLEQAYLEQAYGAVDSQLLERRLLAQTHVEL